MCLKLLDKNTSRKQRKSCEGILLALQKKRSSEGNNKETVPGEDVPSKNEVGLILVCCYSMGPVSYTHLVVQ